MGVEKKKLDESYYELAEAVRKSIRLEFAEFVRVGSLYQKHHFEVVPETFSQIRPAVVPLDCPVCKRVQPFRVPRHSFRISPEANIGNRPAGTSSPESLKSRVYVIGLHCTGCQKAEFACWVEIDVEEKSARKVGQIPPQSITVSKEIDEALEEDVEFYKRAKICLSQSYGVGACAYLRRLIENRITPLLKIVRSAREENGASQEELQKIDDIINGKIASEKIDLAGEVLPESIAVEGDNPIKLLYDELSAGIHRREEQDCVRLAQDGIAAIEHLLVELSRDQKRRESRKTFVDRIRAIRLARNSGSA